MSNILLEEPLTQLHMNDVKFMPYVWIHQHISGKKIAHKKEEKCFFDSKIFIKKLTICVLYTFYLSSTHVVSRCELLIYRSLTMQRVKKLPKIFSFFTTTALSLSHLQPPPTSLQVNERVLGETKFSSLFTADLRRHYNHHPYRAKE
jgi:hypothetical protein